MLLDRPASNAGVCAPPAELVDVLTHCRTAYYRALNLPYDTYDEQAVRADALRLASEQTAAAWTALIHWMVSPGPADRRPPWVYLSAVRTAQRREESNVRFWRDTAEFWHRRAGGLDPADADPEQCPHELSGRWAS